MVRKNFYKIEKSWGKITSIIFSFFLLLNACNLSTEARNPPVGIPVSSNLALEFALSICSVFLDCHSGFFNGSQDQCIQTILEAPINSEDLGIYGDSYSSLKEIMEAEWHNGLHPLWESGYECADAILDMSCEEESIIEAYSSENPNGLNIGNIFSDNWEFCHDSYGFGLNEPPEEESSPDIVF